MAKDSGVIGANAASLGVEQGRWVEDIVAGGRKRCLMIYTKDEKDDANDKSYFGYFADLANAKGCNVAVSLDGENVTIQTIGMAKDAEAKFKTIPVSKFMDLLDTLLS